MVTLAPTAHRLLATAQIIAASTAILCLLFVDFEPQVTTRAKPTAQDIQAAGDGWKQLKVVQKTAGPARIRFDNAMLRGLSSLASDAAARNRVEAEVARGVLTSRASVALPSGLWINASATVSGQHTGFPSYGLKVGRVSFPQFAGRWFASLGHWLLSLRGAALPPLDEIVAGVSIGQEEVLVQLIRPQSTGLVDELIKASGRAVDDALISNMYCRMAAAQQTDPRTELHLLVQRAFSEPYQPDHVERNRAIFVALSFLVVGEQAEALAPQAARLAKSCSHPLEQVLLHRREDLAKHWAFSAALTAILGEAAASNLGEWKELEDSLPEGSGFSFVDLAADRSGVQMALRALDPSTSSAASVLLSRATDHDLLPATLLEAAEGLSEEAFLTRFGGVENGAYTRAIAWIDSRLAQDGQVPGEGS